MIYLKIIAMILLSFLTYNFHLSLAALNYFVGRRKDKFRFLLFDLLVLMFLFLFSGVFLNVIHYSKRRRILLYSVSFCHLK